MGLSKFSCFVSVYLALGANICRLVAINPIKVRCYGLIEGQHFFLIVLNLQAYLFPMEFFFL